MLTQNCLKINGLCAHWPTALQIWMWLYYAYYANQWWCCCWLSIHKNQWKFFTLWCHYQRVGLFFFWFIDTYTFLNFFLLWRSRYKLNWNDQKKTAENNICVRHTSAFSHNDDDDDVYSTNCVDLGCDWKFQSFTANHSVQSFFHRVLIKVGV